MIPAMPYRIKQLADIAGVSVRTLHHYDQIGLLVPVRRARNTYREYGEAELLRLQQILLFKEIDVPLVEIRTILDSPGFDITTALREHQALLKLKRERLTRLMETIDITINRIDKKTPMEDKDLYGNFSKEEMEKYSEEAQKRWGTTDAYKQSVERVKKMGKDGLNRVLKESSEITIQIAECMKGGNSAESPEAQALIAKHYAGLRAFYEPNTQIYRGLAEMYVADPRFEAHYDNVAPGLAVFMCTAMLRYADSLDATR